MKYKCQCGKPYSVDLTKNCRIVNLTNILHFKSADRFCEKCGATLCKDCSTKTPILDGHLGGFEFQYHYEYYCRTCAELEA